MVVDTITAEQDVTIRTEGSVTDKGSTDAIVSENLTIEAGGYIGTKGNPLNVNVRGDVSLTAGIPWVFWGNSYDPGPWTPLPQATVAQAPAAGPRKRPVRLNEQQEEEPEPAQPAPSRPGDAPAGQQPSAQPCSCCWLVLVLLALVALLLLVILWLLWLLWRRRKEEEEEHA